MSFTWRRRPTAGYAVVLLGLMLVGAVYATITGSGSSAASTDPTVSQTQIAEGRQIFQQTCATCHGLEAQGTAVAPSLIGVCAAAVDFQVSTGRMPAKEPGPENGLGPSRQTPTPRLPVAPFLTPLPPLPPTPTHHTERI